MASKSKIKIKSYGHLKSEPENVMQGSVNEGLEPDAPASSTSSLISVREAANENKQDNVPSSPTKTEPPKLSQEKINAEEMRENIKKSKKAPLAQTSKITPVDKSDLPSSTTIDKSVSSKTPKKPKKAKPFFIENDEKTDEDKPGSDSEKIEDISTGSMTSLNSSIHQYSARNDVVNGKPQQPEPTMSKPVTPSGSRLDILSGLRNNVVHPAIDDRSMKLAASPNGSKSDLVSSAASLSLPATTGEHHAYIPYLYAKSCIARIMDDMKNMKIKHIEVVHDIDGNFRAIEKETQNQFNQFILSLRHQFKSKVQTFKQVIEGHRTELKNKEQHWDDALISLSMRNKTLLEEKRRLLLYIQALASRLESEKQEAVNGLTQQIDGNTIQLNEVKKDLKDKEAELENISSLSIAESEKFTTENKVLKDGLNEEKAEVVRLKNELQKLAAAASVAAVVTVAAAATSTSTSEIIAIGEDTVDAVIPYAMPAPTVHPSVESKQLEELHQELLELEAERDQMSEENDQIRHQLNSAKKAIAELEAKNEVLSARMGDYQSLQAQVIVLTAAAALVDKDTCDEKINKNEGDKQIMKEELGIIDKDIEKWQNEFKEKEGRTPTEADKTDAVNELFTQKAEVGGLLENLDKQTETWENLKVGKLPEAPKVEAIPEVQVKTVEVLVPDPVIYEKLIKAKEKMANQRMQISELRNELAKLKAAEATAALRVMPTAVYAPVQTDEKADVPEKSQRTSPPADDRVDELETLLAEEQAAHAATQEELEMLKAQQGLEGTEAEKDDAIAAITKNYKEEMQSKDVEIQALKKEIAHLEDSHYKALPANAIVELKKLRERVAKVEKEKAQVSASQAAIINSEAQLQMRVKGLERMLEKRKETTTDRGPRAAAAPSNDQAVLKRANTELKEQVKQLELQARMNKSAATVAGAGAADIKQLKRQEKVLKELEKKLELEKKKAERNDENFKKRDEEYTNLKKEYDDNQNKLVKMTSELDSLGEAAQAGQNAAVRLKDVETEVKKLRTENVTLVDNFNSERVLRKKYYNIVEDMKGKIRVYCRARPLSKSEIGRDNHIVVQSPDEYTINVNSNRGLKEFQFDQIFMTDSSQERVFSDTNNLIQSAVDGYNVCIFAYGQTGSGKTFTMIGDKEGNYPGIAPRAFNRIFELIEENKSKFKFKITCYMLELYNDKLLDLFGKSGQQDDRMDIKKDKKGLVFVQGAEVKSVTNAKQLYEVFDTGSRNRHVASTMMNAESSRSHLIISIIIESTNKANGSVLRGKLSLVDLAGSERVAKTEASAEQLREANSINKSLSALGDVISALSSEQGFIPYRNNKLTMLMQDSLGGNAKTLMFVNISPADYNADETVISLTYASRVKLITNDASKNADNKEIARLKAVIEKMKKGEAAEAAEEED